MDTVLISCGTLEDEVRKVLAGMSRPPGLILTEAAWHNKPTNQMRAALQKELDALGPEVRRVLMAYGLCGGAINGLVTGNFTLIIPKVNDCIPLLLGSRQKLAEVSRIPSFFLTAGWLKFCNQSYYDTLNRLGEHNTDIAYKMMLANYKRFLLIDTGAYDLRQAQANTAECLQRYLPAELATGDLAWLTRLVTGPWPQQDFLTVLPHSHVHLTAECIDENLAPVIPPAPQKYGREIIQDSPNQKVPGGKPQNLNNTRSSTVLGIDTGGTYTDGVIIDLPSMKILKKAKARTTHDNLTLGIKECVKKLDFSNLSQISMVALSTTLATNAVVEGKGCEVGLIMIGGNSPDQLPVQQYAVVDGGHNGAGVPVKPLDEAGIIKAMTTFAGKVRAIAISSYFSVRNPEHELRAREIVQKHLRVPVVCAHQLTTSLGFPDRTVTAVLNARLLPIIGEWLESIQAALLQSNIKAPLMIVRSDGSLTSIDAALEKPIETLLTGPAASIIGACNLSQKSDAIILDMGGTTTDIAVITNHEPKINQEGAVVGGWHTRVKAAEIYTYGIGGDSYIQVKPDKRLITVGPERVLPLSYAAYYHPNLITELNGLEIISSGLAMNQKTDCFMLAKKLHQDERSHFSPTETRIINMLQDNPHSLYYLSKQLNIDPNFFPSAQLIRNGVISRISITPTDILHVTNEYKLWSCEAAQLGISLLANHLEMSQEDFIKVTKEEITKEITIALVQSLIAIQKDNFQIKKHLNYNFIKKIFESGFDNYFTCKIHIPIPIIAIGAPVKAWLPKIKKILSLDITIPEHAEIANAFGAATADMVERVEVIIRPQQGQAGFSIHLPWEYRVLYDFASAIQYASDAATDWARNRLIQAGSDEPEVQVVRKDLFAESMGDKILLETLLKINAVGKPKLA